MRSLTKEYYVYQIKVDGVIRYIGKGKGDRIYSHLKEAKGILRRNPKITKGRLNEIYPGFCGKLALALKEKRPIKEEILVSGLGDKEAYVLEWNIMKKFVFDGKRNQLYNCIPGSIYTPEEYEAYVQRIKTVATKSRSKLGRTFANMALERLKNEKTIVRPPEPVDEKKVYNDWHKSVQKNLFKQYMRNEAASRGMSEETWYKNYLKKGGKIYGEEDWNEVGDSQVFVYDNSEED